VKKLIEKAWTKPEHAAQRNLFHDERAKFDGGECDSALGS
jgi:hypothetical protein